jgi:hypothetical protein
MDRRRVVPFRRSSESPSSALSPTWPTSSPPSQNLELQATLRRIHDLLTVLALRKPAVVKWLLGWVESFLRGHV